MSLLFKTMSRFEVFLPRGKHLLSSWMQSPFTGILGPRRGNLSPLPPLSPMFAMNYEAVCHELNFFIFSCKPALHFLLVAQMVKNWLHCRRPRFCPWVGKIPWKREWQPTPVFLTIEFHGQRSLVGYSPWSRKELDTTEQLTQWNITQPFKIMK